MEWIIGIVIDIVILLILFLCYKKGAKDGFAKTLVSLLGFVIAIVVASVLCAPVSEFAYDKALKTPIENGVNSVVLSSLPGGETQDPSQNAIDSTVSDIIEKLPSFIRDVTGIETKKDEIIGAVNENINSTAQKIVDVVCNDFIKPFVIKILSVVVFLALFLLTWIACKILAKLLKIINKIPLLGKVNTLLGSIIGLVRGIIIVLVAAFVIVMLTNDGASLFGIINLKTVESSIILRTVSTYNPLNLIITSLIA